VRVSRIGRITSSGKAVGKVVSGKVVLVNAPDSVGRSRPPLLAGWDQLRSQPGG
jgi:hypothetical protein